MIKKHRKTLVLSHFFKLTRLLPTRGSDKWDTFCESHSFNFLKTMIDTSKKNLSNPLKFNTVGYIVQL